MQFGPGAVVVAKAVAGAMVAERAREVVATTSSRVGVGTTVAGAVEVAVAGALAATTTGVEARRRRRSAEVSCLPVAMAAETEAASLSRMAVGMVNHCSFV